jgi:hypothetical protein
VIRYAILLFLLLTTSAVSVAAESADFAKMGRAAWVAFECSSLASVMEKPKDQERLFLFGYDQGKKFLNAMQSGRITQKDLNSTAPSGFLMVAQGPSVDFILGRVFESAQDNALKEVITTETVLSKDLKQGLASHKYTSGNCELIGNGR